MNPLLGLLGLGNRARRLVVGVDGARAALQRGRCHCLVLAADASPRARQKLERLAAGRGVACVVGPASEAMGKVLGRPPVMAVAVTDGALADGIRRAHGKTV